ncbi:tRNA:m(4)X modification enzyme TRM13 [Orchesella cincta]|uniref:tRNA:m(4)X modification enzyme TRM13 n=1 Tax=Orchesella cincta TaxID=48709 RepID=A0A1D2N758_ORCCI|nr:tRNA:m(4)X modification enzyme TRM13 [Orchesella cincta]
MDEKSGNGVVWEKPQEILEDEVLKNYWQFYWGPPGVSSGTYYPWMNEAVSPTESQRREPTSFKEMMAIRKAEEAEKMKKEAAGKPKEEVLPCDHFLTTKNRHCRLSRVSGARYCAEHINLQDDLWVFSESQNRQPCPYDRNHTVAVAKMKKHLKKCNSRPLKEADVPYYRKSINSLSQKLEQIGNVCSSKPLDNLNIQTMSESEKLELIAEVIQYHHENVGKIKENPGIHPLLQSDFEKTEDNALRHKKQSASLLNIMQDCGLLKDSTCFIEYGSGRGGLSYELVRVLAKQGVKNCKIFLIDRSSPRYKWDNKAKRSDEFNAIEIERVRINVEDLFIGNLGGFNGLLHFKHIVGIAKHMCGSATDIALKSLLETTTDIQKKVSGFVFATCCHHRIEYVDFLGSDSLMPHFTRKKFSALKQLAAWATDGYYETSYIKEDIEIPETLSKVLQEVEAKCPEIRMKYCIGRLVKQIFDNARRSHINKLTGPNMLYSMLVQYVESTTTPENMALVARIIA